MSIIALQANGADDLAMWLQQQNGRLFGVWNGAKMGSEGTTYAHACTIDNLTIGFSIAAGGGCRNG
jgi:hypothetical protein